MSDRRKCLRTQAVLPLRYTPLTPEESELVVEGKGSTLLETAVPAFAMQLQGSPSDLHSTDQESVVLQYLRLLDAKLNWIIEHLTADEEPLAAQAETINLGGNGLCFAAAEDMSVGALLRIKLQLNLIVPQWIDFIAEVVRVDRRPNNQLEVAGFAIAAKIVEIEEEQREKIFQFIFGKERQELRRRKEDRVSGG